MSGDVLRRTAAGPLADDFVIAILLFRGELALGMRVQMSSFLPQDKHQQQLGIEPWRRYVVGDEELVGRIDGLFELHGRRMYRNGCGQSKTDWSPKRFWVRRGAYENLTGKIVCRSPGRWNGRIPRVGLAIEAEFCLIASAMDPDRKTAPPVRRGIEHPNGRVRDGHSGNNLP